MLATYVLFVLDLMSMSLEQQHLMLLTEKGLLSYDEETQHSRLLKGVSGFFDLQSDRGDDKGTTTTKTATNVDTLEKRSLTVYPAVEQFGYFHCRSADGYMFIGLLVCVFLQ